MHHRARDHRVDVAISQADEAGAERREDLLLQPVGEVGGVEQIQGDVAQRVALLGAYQPRPDQR